MKRRFEDGKGGKGESKTRRSGPGQVEISMPCVLKFQTPEVLASAVIGKGGQVIAAMRQNTGAKIALTEHGEFFPGTDCRVLIAQANSEDALAEVLRQIIFKVAECVEVSPSEVLGQPGELRLRTMAPKAAVGGLIGKGGHCIKQLRESTGAKISISDPVGAGPGAEQVVTISGNQQALEHVMLEANRQVQALSSEDWFRSWASTTGTAAGGGHGPRNGADYEPQMHHGGKDHGGKGRSSKGHGGGADGSYGGAAPPVPVQHFQSSHPMDNMIQIGQSLPPYVMEDSRGFAMSCVVPNRLVGGIIGRGGAGTKEIQQMTGTKIGIREIPGDPENRSLNIAGPLADTCAAYMLMMKRYLDSEAQSSGPPPANY